MRWGRVRLSLPGARGRAAARAAGPPPSRPAGPDPDRRRDVWRRCTRIADSLTLPDPFDAGAFIAALARERGRPIELLPVAWQPSTPCGLLVTADQADYILYCADTSTLHQQHILLHEAAHLLCGHQGGTGQRPLALTPHLSPELVRRVLGRTVYTEPEEEEAELLASLVLHRLAWSAPAARGPSAEQLRLGAVLGLTADRGPRSGAGRGRSRDGRGS
ncbi:ParH-like protein [Kitasatospora sp. NPDC056138]|uniref:ParH-like protein n=1 Tax=Kitasatospora sp. NPDC056138 TaxID=3345724 RepID=UPI0035E045D7